MTTETRGKFIINVGFWVVILAIIYLAFKYFLPLIMPFFIAIVVAALLRPAVKFISRKIPIKQNIVALVCVLLFYIIIAVLLFLLSARLTTTLLSFVQRLPEMYTSSVQPGLEQMFAKVENVGQNLSPEANELLGNLSSTLLNAFNGFIERISAGALSMLSNIASGFPGFIIATVMCLIATVFLSMDYSRIMAFIGRQLPERAKEFTVSARDTTVSVMKHYGKSYLLIMLMTFVELALGLLIIGVKHPIMMAVIIAVVDIFPIVGSGLFLWPWAALLFVQGNTGQGIGMVILYIIITCVRQVMEPKIVGGHVGLHPLVTLVCMFVGSKLFGGVGLFGLPILAAVIRNLDDSGVINIFKKKPHTDGNNDASVPESAPPSGREGDG